jgi:hypothetical protein
LFQNAARAENEAAAEPPQHNVLAEFDIAKGGDVVVLPVTIGERSYPFLLSIASYRTSVDSPLRPLLGKRIERDTDQADGIEAASDEFPPIPMRIGEFAFTPAEPIICRSFDRHREYLGHEIYGIVGMDFLRGRIVEIDFDEGKIRILTKFPRPTPPGAAFSIIWKSDRQSAMHVKIPGMGTELFALDTGFLCPVSLCAPTIDELLKNKQASDVQDGRPLWPGAGTVPRVGCLKELTLAKWTFKDLWFVEGRNSIGLPVLSQFRLVFDFKDINSVLLTPGQTFGQPEGIDWGGMDILMKKDRVTVERVTPNLAAAAAGIRPGDVLTKVNGKPPRDWGLFEIRRMFMGEKTVVVTFRRPQQKSSWLKEFTVTFKDPKFSISRKEIVPAGGMDDSKP